jgi:hypothetical protein
MSKFTRVRTQITSKEVFCQALDSLGIQYQADGFKSYENIAVKIPAQLFTTPWGKDATILGLNGVQLIGVNGGFELGWNEDYPVNAQAARMITQQYALTVVQQAVADRGMQIAEMEMQPDGSIRARVISYGAAQQQAVETTVAPDGTVTANLTGFQGQGCAPVVQQIQQVLGGQVLDEGNNDDWYRDDGSALWRNDYDQA